MNPRETCEGCVYLRRSDSRQELSFDTQLDWALGAARDLRVSLVANSSDVRDMLQIGQVSRGHIFLDNGITGANLARPGLVALRSAVKADRRISHVFAYRRDRLGRPEDLLEMMQIEMEFVEAGVTLVFSEGICRPSPKGTQDLSHILQMLIGYHESGSFLQTHAERIIQAQRRLARDGFRTGGNAPYGFARYLVDAAGKKIEALPPGRRIKQAGCHVRIFPDDAQKIGVWICILELRHKGWGCKRIARYLNELGIPSPGAESIRTDHGAKHVVSGKWCANTVADLCRNPAILGLQEYGQRSEGAHRRLGADGARLLSDSDRLPNQSPRVVFNEPSLRISAPIGSAAQYSLEKWQAIQDQTANRGRSQRGVRRAKDPGKYPLACRVHDLSAGCGAIMYGVTVSRRRLYRCGRYMKSAGADCEQNSVDAEALLHFVTAVLGNKLLDNARHNQLKELLAQKAAEGTDVFADESRLVASRDQVENLQRGLATIERRFALEQDEALQGVLGRQLKQIQQELAVAERHLQKLENAKAHRERPAAETAVAQAMALLDQFEAILSDDEARGELPFLFTQLGLRVGLYFRSAVLGKKRVIRQVAGGVLSFGDRPLPVPIHGPDNLATKHAEHSASSAEIGDQQIGLLPATGGGTQLSVVGSSSCAQESNSLRKVSWGDCPSFEPWVTTIIDAALCPDDEPVALTRIRILSA